MAESITPRFGLNLWSAESDTVSRSEFQTNFQNLENLGAIDRQGTLANRPVTGKSGTYYYATDQKVLYRDTGTEWVVVGSNLAGFTSTAPNVSSPAATIRGVTGQSSDLYRILNSTNVLLSSFTKDGALKSGGVYIAGNTNEVSSSRVGGAAFTTIPLSPEQPAHATKALHGQSANIAEWRDSNNRVATRINNQAELVMVKPQKETDTNAVEANELVTFGHMKRALPEWSIQAMTLTEYNALLVKSPKTLYVING